MSLISLPRRLVSSALILLIPVFLFTAMLVMVSTSHSAHAQAVVAPTCPQGYVLSGGQCVASAPVPTCPSGYTYSAGKCVAGSPAPSTGPWVFIVNISLGVKSALELDGATVCLVPGSASQAVTTGFFQTNQLTFTPVAADTHQEVLDAYDKNACDTVVVEDSIGNATIDTLKRPNDHGILPERLGGSAASSPPPVRRTAPAPPRPVNLALPLQTELKRIGCLTGRVDGVLGRWQQSRAQQVCQPGRTAPGKRAVTERTR